MEIRNLDFNYEPGSPQLIDDLSLMIEPGMFLTVLGENGSAKSTLVRLMLGLLTPVNGRIIRRAKRIGYVPQKKDKFNMRFPITVKELLAIHMNGKTSQPARAFLDLVEMGDAQDKLFGELSGGQQQRVLIARAVSGEPDLLILDEPLTGIDSHSRELIRDLLLDLNSKGMTIISIEHDVAFAVHHSSHILTMKEGDIRLYGVDEYRHRMSHEDQDNYLYHREEHDHAEL